MLLGIIFIGVLLLNGLYYMMPFEAVNPYEYLSGSNLSSYQVLDIFIGGAIVPLVALAIGYTIHEFKDYGIGNLAKITAFVLALGIVQTFFIFAFDFLPGLALMTLVALFFLRTGFAVTFISGMALFLFHLVANILVGFFANIGSPSDIIYTALQDVNNYTSVFTNSDYFAMIGLNIEIFSGNGASTLYTLVFTVLPWLLVGISLGQVGIARFARSNLLLNTLLFILLAGGGIAIKIIQVLTLGSYSGRLLAENFGGPVLALGYFVLLIQLTTMVPARILEIFRRMGRYALTLYILSNVIFMLIFYGIGMRLYGEVEITGMVWIALMLYIFLMVLATVMHRYQISSLENLFTNNSENGINK
ncbi:DUF418 domain-containing protein [Salinicoccus hispanicus]|uniref:DUF418 domain-containing protein n=2 Tax=Salinicoccus hispanicus TaxID=157225 RepID=A0A6N8TY93_9STAP|nr:DUF418 domain-containing protein [Salinicoccus hispanicus]